MELMERIFPLDRTYFHHLTGVTWFTYKIEFEFEIRFKLENLSIELHIDQDVAAGDHIRTYMVPFLNQFALDEVKKITLYCSPSEGLTKREWRRLLSRISSLETLVYCHWQDGGCQGLDLCEYLGNRRTLVCPTLRTLELQSIQFEEGKKFTTKTPMTIT